MLSSLRKDDSCFNINKYYQKKKKTESFNFDDCILNSKDYRAMPSFLNTFKQSSCKSLSQRDLILPIIFKNNSLNDLNNVNNNNQIINDYNYQSKFAKRGVKGNNVNQTQRPKLNIMKLILEEDYHYSHRNRSLFGNSLKEPDIDYFLSKIIKCKSEIVKKINEAFALDCLFDYNVKKNIEETSREFEKALSNQGRVASNFRWNNKNNNNKEIISPRIAMKYIAFEEIIYGVVSHCLEVKNSSNKILTIQNINNYFEEEVQKIRNKYDTVPKQKHKDKDKDNENDKHQNEIIETLMNQIIPIENKIIDNSKTKVSLGKTHNNNNSYINNYSTDLNSSSKLDAKNKSKQMPALNYQDFHNVLNQITEKIIQSTTTLKKTISNELKKGLLLKYYKNKNNNNNNSNNSSTAVIEDEYSHNNNGNDNNYKQVSNASFSLSNQFSSQMRHYFNDSKDKSLIRTKSLSNINEHKSRNAKRTGHQLRQSPLTEEVKGEKSKSISPMDTDILKLIYTNNKIKIIQNDKGGNINDSNNDNNKGINIFDKATKTIFTALNQINTSKNKTIIIKRNNSNKKSNGLLPESSSRYEIIKEMIHLNTEMEFLDCITRNTNTRKEMQLSIDEDLLKNKMIQKAIQMSKSQILFLNQNYYKQNIDFVDCIGNRSLTHIDNYNNYNERTKSLTRRLRWIKVSKKNHQNNEKLLKDIIGTHPGEIKAVEKRKEEIVNTNNSKLKQKKIIQKDQYDNNIKKQINDLIHKDKAKIKAILNQKPFLRDQSVKSVVNSNKNKKSNTKEKKEKQSFPITKKSTKVFSHLTKDNNNQHQDENLSLDLLDETNNKTFKDKEITRAKVALLANQLHKSLHKEYGPKDRFNEVINLFQFNQMKSNLKKRPLSYKGFKIKEYIDRITINRDLNASVSYFPKKIYYSYNKNKSISLHHLTKAQITFFENEQKKKFTRKEQQMKRHDNLNEEDYSLYNPKALKGKSPVIISLKNKEMENDSLIDKSYSNPPMSINQIQNKQKQSQQSNSMILLHKNATSVLPDENKEGNETLKNILNEQSSQSSLNNTVENSLIKIREEAQAQAQKGLFKYKTPITKKFNHFPKSNVFDVNNIRQDKLVGPLLIYKSKDERDQIEPEYDIDILTMFREICSSSPEDYTKRMTEFLDLQLLRSDNKVKVLLEERMSKFKENLSQNLLRKREYQNLIGSKMKFQDQSVVSLSYLCFSI